MNVQSKKVFAAIDYLTCDPAKCDPDKGLCSAVSACEHKILKQLDDAFEPPMIFQNLCMACRDCIEACPLGAIHMKQVS